MLGSGLDLDLDLDLHNNSVFELDFNYELDLDFDVGHDLDIYFNLMMTLTESQACIENLVQSQFRSENLCLDGVVGWGGGCPAENKDQLKFELIEIRGA